MMVGIKSLFIAQYCILYYLLLTIHDCHSLVTKRTPSTFVEHKQFAFRRQRRNIFQNNDSGGRRTRTVLLDKVIVADDDNSDNENDKEDEVDIAIIGAGIGGLCAGAILNTLYGKKVGVYESHYLPGGCAHAFDRKVPSATSPTGFETLTFDSGPTILLGCSKEPYNPLQQVLTAIGQDIEWVSYDSWGIVENPTRDNERQWKLQLGPNIFQRGPLSTFGGPTAIQEFEELRKATQPLVGGGSAIPVMAMRVGNSAIFPLLRYLPPLLQLLQQGELTTGTFEPFMDGPIYTVKDQWLRNWLDALAFSLSGLPASRTSAAAMAFVLYDMHRSDATLDYPRGGFGELIEALVRGVEQGPNQSKVHLRRHVESIDACNDDDTRVQGITLANGKRVLARDGVICNAPIWSLRKLIQDPKMLQKLTNNNDSMTSTKPAQQQYSWETSAEGSYIKHRSNPQEQKGEEQEFLSKMDTAEMTGSFLHLHLAINATGLDLTTMEPHYTVMDRSLAGNETIVPSIDGIPDGPCGELNMIAVSNPGVIDDTLAPPGYMILHAYGAGNEPYQIWEGMDRTSEQYQQLKERRGDALWRAVESIIPDVRDRTVYHLLGSPLTHERFLRRPKGSYGVATEDVLKDGSTPYTNLILAGDSIFPGIGMPAVALSGASAANSFVNVFQHWSCLDTLKEKGKL